MSRFFDWLYYKLIVLGWVKSRKKEYYVSLIHRNAKWVYVSYIPEVLCAKLSAEEMRSHQNKQEQVVMVRTLNSMGYNVFVQAYNSTPIFPITDVEIVFGLEPVFEEACRHYPDAKKIYYATGAYYEFQNSQVQRMTDYVNRKCNSQLPYRRIVSPHKSVEMADAVLQIGSKYTIQTYPENLRKKITCIHQSTQGNNDNCILYAEENEFLLIASEGNVLKGCFHVIEYFGRHTEFVLHWVGPVENDFLEVVSPFMKSNIKIYGFIDLNSETMHSIVSKCNYVIYLSGSEGCPGAVLNAMKFGLIPILSKWAAFDEIDEYGYVVENNIESDIDKVMLSLQQLEKSTIIALKKKCSKYICQTYTLERYAEELLNYFKKIVG